MPLPDSRRSASVKLGQQAPRRLDERLDRQAIALVVVLPVLIADRRSEPDRAVDRAGQVHAESVARRVRQRIDERVDERSLGGRQLGVLAAARIDRERLAPEQSRHLVCIQAGRVHHRAREDRFALGVQHDPVAVWIRAGETGAWQERDTRRLPDA